jgi:hypothetical protein
VALFFTLLLFHAEKISVGGRLGEPVRRRGPDTLDALPAVRIEDIVEPPIETVWRTGDNGTVGDNALLDGEIDGETRPRDGDLCAECGGGGERE